MREEAGRPVRAGDSCHPGHCECSRHCRSASSYAVVSRLGRAGWSPRSRTWGEAGGYGSISSKEERLRSLSAALLEWQTCTASWVRTLTVAPSLSVVLLPRTLKHARTPCPTPPPTPGAVGSSVGGGRRRRRRSAAGPIRNARRALPPPSMNSNSELAQFAMPVSTFRGGDAGQLQTRSREFDCVSSLGPAGGDAA